MNEKSISNNQMKAEQIANDLPDRFKKLNCAVRFSSVWQHSYNVPIKINYIHLIM